MRALLGQMQLDYIAAAHRIDRPEMLSVPRDAVRHRLEPPEHLRRDTRMLPQITAELHFSGALHRNLHPAHGFRFSLRGFGSGSSLYISETSFSISSRSSGSGTSSIGFAPG